MSINRLRINEQNEGVEERNFYTNNLRQEIVSAVEH